MGTPNKLSQQVDETGPQVQASVIVDPTNPQYQLKINPDGSLNVGTSETSGTGSPTSVPAATTSTQLLAANANRKFFSVFNESPATMYLSLAAGGTNTSYTSQVPPNNLYEPPVNYTGVVSAQWSSTTGNARITEMS